MSSVIVIDFFCQSFAKESNICNFFSKIFVFLSLASVRPENLILIGTLKGMSHVNLNKKFEKKFRLLE